jgi:VCBS repeat-containing protein
VPDATSDQADTSDIDSFAVSLDDAGAAPVVDAMQEVGDDGTAATDGDSSVSGQLTVSDLDAGTQANEHFGVTSADGPVHQVDIDLTGTDDAPALDATQELGAGGTAVTAATATAANPLDDYLQFAAPATEVGADGTADDTTASPLDDYLAAAGVDASTATADAPDLPPTDVLLEAAHTAEVHTAPDHTSTDEASLAAPMADIPDQPDIEQHHHGV